MKKIVTLDEFIINSQTTYSDSTGQLTRLLRDLGIAAKIINREVNLAGLVNIIGVANVDKSINDCYYNQKYYICAKYQSFCHEY